MKHRMLRARMIEQGIDGIHMARILRTTPTTVSSRLCAKSQWKGNEIVTICKALNIDMNDIPKYFFDTSSSTIAAR